MDSFLDSIDDILGEDFLNTFEFDQSCNWNDNFSPGGSTTRFCTGPQPCTGSPPLGHASGPPPQRQNRAPRDAAPVILHFGDTDSGCPLNHEEEAISGIQTANKNSRKRSQSQIYNHIVSERQRRKLLGEHFVTLSRMVPGLKKMDKTSVLGATIEYIQSLQEQAEILKAKHGKGVVESAVLVRKSQIMIEEEEEEEEGGGGGGGYSDENSGCSSCNQPLPEIEAKVCNNQALLKIHCEKQQGIMVKILAEVDKLNLSILHSNVSPFGNSALDVTIVVEMDNERTSTANQIVQALHSAFKTAS